MKIVEVDLVTKFIKDDVESSSNDDDNGNDDYHIDGDNDVHTSFYTCQTGGVVDRVAFSYSRWLYHYYNTLSFMEWGQNCIV